MIFKILLFSFGLILITILLKDQMKSLALMVSVAGCVGLFMIALNIVSHLVSVAKGFGFSDGIASESIGVIAKTLGVAYLTNFGSDICSDAGEKAIGTALETAGKMIMLSMAFPMLSGIFSSVMSIMGGGP